MHALSDIRPAGWTDRLIGHIAARQFGVVAHRQLIAAGVSRDAIRWRLRAGRLHQLYRGVYLVGHPVPPPRAAEMAAQLACGPRALNSHWTAGRLIEIVPLPREPKPIDITVVGRRAQRGRGIRIHHVRELDQRDAIRAGPLRLTSPARTLLDLASVATPGQLENAVAQARRRGLVNEADLADQLARNRGRRGVGRLRKLLELERGPALTRSRPERRLLELLRASDLPEPEANQVVCGFEVDLLWRRQRLVVEFDSREFHADPHAFERDRARDAELAAHGYVVIRLTWRQLTQESERALARIRQALRHR